MDVYLIPLGSIGEDRYELYCEPARSEIPSEDSTTTGSGPIAKLVTRIKKAIARVESESAEEIPAHSDPSKGMMGRVERWMLRWIAERLAEWRLLWRLRKESEVTLYFPDDIGDAAANEAARSILRREASRHLKWTMIDGVLLAASGIVAIVPGPNLIAYFFGFRFVGHLLSRRGATHGLHAAQWRSKSSAQLSILRQAMSQIGRASCRERV